MTETNNKKISFQSGDFSLDLSAVEGTEPEVGQLLAGRYRVVREIGRGGMAIVYEANDEKLDGLKVAIKVLPPALSKKSQAVAKLKQEALTAMSLTHPNIVRVHGFDDDVDVCFLVMEFLNGENMDEIVLQRGALPLSEVLEVARGAVAGLSAAHERRIIHRDIKPANLMFSTDPGGKRLLKVTDFGIAFEIHDTLSRMTGSFGSGTLLYMSPEHLNGEVPDERSDQYSLAVTIYELLAGRPPYYGVNAIQSIIHGDPQPIPEIPDHVNGAIFRAMSKDPEDRFVDVKAFLSALEGIEESRREVLAAMVEPQPIAAEVREFANSLGMKFIKVPAGSFVMGSPKCEKDRWRDEGPQRTVEFAKSFWLSETLVTQEIYAEVMGESPSTFLGEDKPVEGVNWLDACAFCRKLTDRTDDDYVYRLPSESQWEYACRAGSVEAVYSGHPLDAVAWYCENSGESAQPVKRRHPNEWGFYDMLGNLWEWCRDRWHDDYDNAPTDGSAWLKGREERRVLRGGAWNCRERSLRCAARHACVPGLRLPVFGFRVVIKNH